MRRIFLITIIGSLVVGTVFSQASTRLVNVRKIYIDNLGSGPNSDLVKEKMRIRLMKSQRFTVVEKSEAADAILTGIATVDQEYEESIRGDTNGVQGSGGTTYSGNGVIRLVDPKTSETIWIYEYKRGFGVPRPAFLPGPSASSSVADKTIDQLIKDARDSEKKRK